MARRLSFEEALSALREAADREAIYDVLERCTLGTLEDIVVSQKLHVHYKAQDKKANYVSRICSAIVDRKKEEATKNSDGDNNAEQFVEYVQVEAAYREYDKAQGEYDEKPDSEELAQKVSEAREEYKTLQKEYAERQEISPTREREETLQSIRDKLSGSIWPMQLDAWSNRTLIEMSHKVGIEADFDTYNHDMAVRLLRAAGIATTAHTWKEKELFSQANNMRNLYEEDSEELDMLQQMRRELRKELHDLHVKRSSVRWALKSLDTDCRKYSGILLLKADIETEVAAKLKEYAEICRKLPEVKSKVEARQDYLKKYEAEYEELRGTADARTEYQKMLWKFRQSQLEILRYDWRQSRKDPAKREAYKKCRVRSLREYFSFLLSA